MNTNEYSSKFDHFNWFPMCYHSFHHFSQSWSNIHADPSKVDLHAYFHRSCNLLNLWWNRWKISQKNKKWFRFRRTIWPWFRCRSLHDYMHPPISQFRFWKNLDLIYCNFGNNVNILSLYIGKTIHWCFMNKRSWKFWIIRRLIGRSVNTLNNRTCWSLSFHGRRECIWSRNQFLKSCRI